MRLALLGCLDVTDDVWVQRGEDSNGYTKVPLTAFSYCIAYWLHQLPCEKALAAVACGLIHLYGTAWAPKQLSSEYRYVITCSY